MKKELPKVFKNNINKELNNNDKFFYGNNRISEKKDNRSVIEKINDIFSAPNYVYKANVDIILKDKTITKKIIGRNKEYIITMDNELIPIKNIMDIKAQKK